MSDFKGINYLINELTVLSEKAKAFLDSDEGKATLRLVEGGYLCSHCGTALKDQKKHPYEHSCAPCVKEFGIVEGRFKTFKESN